MITKVTLNETQLQTIIADAAGCRPEDVTISVVGGSVHVIADVATDYKGAGKIQRVLAKYEAKP